MPILLTQVLWFNPNLAKVSVSRAKMKSERRGRCKLIYIRLICGVFYVWVMYEVKAGLQELTILLGQR